MTVLQIMLTTPCTYYTQKERVCNKQDIVSIDNVTCFQLKPIKHNGCSYNNNDSSNNFKE